MHRQPLLDALARYRTRYLDEAAMVERVQAFVRQHPNCFDRELQPGHVSASAWVLNPAWSHVVMLHHRKLDRWFQPGGHADGDPDLQHVALRETSEETGVEQRHLRLLTEEIFDVDIHSIPAGICGARHDHFDIRYLLELDESVPIAGNQESYDVRWVSLQEVRRLNNDRSVHRMIEKTQTLRRGSTAAQASAAP